MGVFKEEITAFERVAAQQKLIYKDAADMGVRIDRNQNPQVRSTMKATVAAMYQAKLVENRHSWGGAGQGGVAWRFFIAVEIVDGKQAGYEINMSWNQDAKRGVEFIAVDMSRATRDMVAK